MCLSNLCVKESSRWFWCRLKFEKHRNKKLRMFSEVHVARMSCTWFLVTYVVRSFTLALDDFRLYFVCVLPMLCFFIIAFLVHISLFFQKPVVSTMGKKKGQRSQKSCRCLELTRIPWRTSTETEWFSLQRVLLR